MASFNNSKLPPNLEKPPLFSSGYRAGGSDIVKHASFSALSAQPRLNGVIPALSAPSNDIKVPKLENELVLNTNSDAPNLKRQKITNESQHMPTPSFACRGLTAVPLFAHHSLPINVDHENSYHHEETERETKERRVAVENRYNPLTERSLLGLNLRKSPSLLDLIQSKLDSANGDQSGRFGRLGSCAVSAEKDKLKAANFPASKLRIGKWECTSCYDGGLVAKCYYAKRKLVWEVLDGRLKSKMEMQWSDISALRAVFSDDQSAILDIEISRPPLFYRESEPQPRKHTLWHSTSDFTNGQATICRHHSIQFLAGVFNRHFEKLLECDARLKALSEQTHNIQDSCFFDNRGIQIDRQHMLHYQSVLSDHVAIQPLTMPDDAFLQPASDCTVDYSQSHLSSQSLQSEASQHFSLHHGGVEIVRSIRTDGPRTEVPLQLRDHLRCSVGSGVQSCHLQGAFQQSTAAASPSSVIDTRGLNESSCSDETEETLSMDSRSEPRNLHVLQDAQHCTSRQLNQWTSHQLHDNMISWTEESKAVSPPMNDLLEKQALNKLSLSLIGEPIPPAEQSPYCVGAANAHIVQDMLISNGPSFSQESNSFRDFAYRHDKNCNVHYGQMNNGQFFMKVQESPWNAVLEQRAILEAGSSSLASHGSFTELVYLPRIASQPQFLEPAP